MANNSNQEQKTLGEQMADLLRRKPKNFDVVFCVGPDKIKVEAVKFILKAASPVFETEFEENWENAVVTGDSGIPLLDIDPTAFQLFVNLLILDAWSLDSLKSLNLSPNNLLNLLGLCRRYEITKAIGNLEEEVDDFIQSFAEYSDTDEFLKLSRKNLEAIFSMEKLPLNESKIFDCAARWAGNQCIIKGLEQTGENYREVFGTCLFQIRFPTMTTEEFSKVCKFKNNFLNGDEQLAIFLFISSTIYEKTSYDTTQLPFKTNCRVAVKPNRINRTVSENAPPQIITTNNREVNPSPSSGCSVLSLPQQYRITTSPSFVCDGSQRYQSFQVNAKISLHGVGFLGPIDGDANFVVTVQIRRWVTGSYTFDSGTFTKNIFAQKEKIFYFSLDEPIAVECSPAFGSWGDHYGIWFNLKGPNDTAQYQGDNPKEESLEASGVQFHLYRSWNKGSPLAELLFTKI